MRCLVDIEEEDVIDQTSLKYSLLGSIVTDKAVNNYALNLKK